MKIDIQYINDSRGNIQSVQLPFTEWEKIVLKLHKYEQQLKMTSNLTEAFEQVELLKKSKMKRQTLTDFLNEI